MIIGVGVDLVDISRLARDLARERWEASSGVFAADEIAYCSAGGRPEQRFAACFAAKEATLKALGTEIPDLGILREVELTSGEGKRSAIVLHHRARAIAEQLGARHINLSLAVGKKKVGAMVILES